MRFCELFDLKKGLASLIFIIGLAACADTNHMSVSEMVDTNVTVDSASPVFFISPTVGCHQGYATDGTNHYIFDTGRFFVRSNDANWSIIRTNFHPFVGLTNINHLGDGDYHDGKLYVVAETWKSCDVFSNQSILVFDAKTLERLNCVCVSNQNHEVSGLVVVPEEGENGTIYVTSFCDGTKLFKYDLKTLAFRGTFPLKTPILSMQGLTYHNGIFYISSNPGPIYAVNRNGDVQWLYTNPLKGSHEGLAYSHGALHWLIDQGKGNSHVYYLRFPGLVQ